MLCKVAGVARSGLGGCSLTSGVLQRPKGGWHSATTLAAIRSLSTEKTDTSKVAGDDTRQKKQPPAVKSTGTPVIVTKGATKKRRFVTSARILPDGFVRPALYDEGTPIPR
ncbi:hypothetical protein LPJ74_005308, partial [Coemansia sp. RSA 1843]